MTGWCRCCGGRTRECLGSKRVGSSIRFECPLRRFTNSALSFVGNKDEFALDPAKRASAQGDAFEVAVSIRSPEPKSLMGGICDSFSRLESHDLRTPHVCCGR